MSEDQLTLKARVALKIIRSWIISKGRPPTMRELMAEMKYKSPRSSMLLIHELVVNGYIERKIKAGLRIIKDLQDNEIAKTVSIPLVGNIICRIPLLAEQNIEAMIQVTIELMRPSATYFLVRAKGNSMNKAGIKEGDLVLIRQQSVAENGDYVLALIDDSAIINEYYRQERIVMLLPRSTEKKHKPIILTSSFIIQGIVAAVIPNGEFL